MKHRRYRPKHQRAGCDCGGKAAKVFGTRGRKGARPRVNAGHARDYRLAASAAEQGVR